MTTPLIVISWDNWRLGIQCMNFWAHNITQMAGTQQQNIWHFKNLTYGVTLRGEVCCYHKQFFNPQGSAKCPLCSLWTWEALTVGGSVVEGIWGEERHLPRGPAFLRSLQTSGVVCLAESDAIRFRASANLIQVMISLWLAYLHGSWLQFNILLESTIL